MGLTQTAVEEAFEAIIEDNNLMFDKDFMMNIFSGIADNVEPFQAYLQFMFEEKMSDGLSRNDDDSLSVGSNMCSSVIPFMSRYLRDQ